LKTARKTINKPVVNRKLPTFHLWGNECHKIDTSSLVRKTENMRLRQNVPGWSKMASKAWNRLSYRTVTTSCTVHKKTQIVCVLLRRNAVIGNYTSSCHNIVLALHQIPALIKSASSLKMLYSCILCVIVFCCLNFHKNLQEKIWDIVKFQQKGYTVAWISFHFRRWEEKMTWSNQMKFRLGVYCKLSLIRPPIDKPSPLAPVISLHRHVPWTKRGTAKLFTVQRNYTSSLAAIKNFWSLVCPLRMVQSHWGMT